MEASYGPARLDPSDGRLCRPHFRSVASDLLGLLWTAALFDRAGCPDGPLPPGDQSLAHPTETSGTGLHAAGGLIWMGT